MVLEGNNKQLNLSMDIVNRIKSALHLPIIWKITKTTIVNNVGYLELNYESKTNIFLSAKQVIE